MRIAGQEDRRGGHLPELDWQRRIVLSELGMRTKWFIRLRWGVPPTIVTGVAVASWLGFSVAHGPLLAVAGFVLAYNAALYVSHDRFLSPQGWQVRALHRFAMIQVGLDYVSMFLLVHYSGGVTSPLMLFAIFHVILAALLMPSRFARRFAAGVTFGMAVIAAGEHLGWIPFHGLAFRGEPAPAPPALHHALVSLGAFAAAMLITALMTTAIARMLRMRIRDLAEATRRISLLNERLEALYMMTQAIATRQRLDEVLHIVTRELTHVLVVQATSVKLLDDKGSHLTYAAAHGLPEGWTKEKTVDLAKSPLHRRIVDGEPFVTGRIESTADFQFGEALTAAGIRSVLLVPLLTEDRVIGILGAYCSQPDRFTKGDVEFFRLASDLVAMGVENARAYEALQRAGEHRARFMRQAAHNLRAPLAAVISMVEVLREGYMGTLAPQQEEQLRRVERRAKSMLTLINELLTLASTQQSLPTDVPEDIRLEELMHRLDRTFGVHAAEREVSLSFTVDDDLPPVRGNPVLVEQMIENLVSNAIKYTQAGGNVDVRVEREGEKGVRIRVADTGIGIPSKEQPNLFTEFFRASNAKSFEQTGTGLGLAIVKEVTERMGGWVDLQSMEGEGTTVTVHVPTSNAGA